MNVINGSYHEGEQYFILDTDQLKIGDIILEHGYAKHSDVICSQTGSRYSHAMIYVGGTIIEATLDGGVFSRVPNRSAVRDINDFKVLRLKETADVNMFLHITDYARSLLGSKYSVAQALSVKGGGVYRIFIRIAGNNSVHVLSHKAMQKGGYTCTGR